MQCSRKWTRNRFRFRKIPDFLLLWTILAGVRIVAAQEPMAARIEHAGNFRPDQIVSSDALRALVGTSEHDQRASKDAFDVLGLILERRLGRGDKRDN